jgi:hypothetical protein
MAYRAPDGFNDLKWTYMVRIDVRRDTLTRAKVEELAMIVNHSPAPGLRHVLHGRVRL